MGLVYRRHKDEYRCVWRIVVQKITKNVAEKILSIMEVVMAVILLNYEIIAYIIAVIIWDGGTKIRCKSKTKNKTLDFWL